MGPAHDGVRASRDAALGNAPAMAADEGSDRGRILTVEPFEPVTLEALRAAAAAAGHGTPALAVGPALAAWRYYEEHFGADLDRTRVGSVKLIYSTVTLREGRRVPQVVSARFIAPDPFWFQEGRAVPLVSLQHPTQPLRAGSPTLVSMWDDGDGTVPLGYLLAYLGYAVLMPDTPGLGVNHDVHPFCHRGVADSVRDGIHAVLRSRELWGEGPGQVRWNGQLFLMGYSEGGYATMVTSELLQREGTRIAGAAVLGAPLSLSKVMRELILREDRPPELVNPSPYTVPLLVAAYEDFYGNQRPRVRDFDFDRAIVDQAPGVSGNYADRLREQLDGRASREELSAWVRKVRPYVGPQSVLKPGFLRALRAGDPRAQPMAALIENDAIGGWTPRMPLYFAHHADDDEVSVENTRLALREHGGLPNVSGEELLETVEGVRGVHKAAAPVAYVHALRWIDQLAYPNRPRRQ